MWVLYGKSKGMTSLRSSQSGTGAFLDSCFNGWSMCGSVRWSDLRKRNVVRIVREIAGEIEQIRFGGGVARSVWIGEIELCIGSVRAIIRHVVVSGQLPWLLGEQSAAVFQLGLDFSKRKVIQDGRVLASWNAGCMPMLQVESSTVVPGTLELARGQDTETCVVAETEMVEMVKSLAKDMKALVSDVGKLGSGDGGAAKTVVVDAVKPQDGIEGATDIVGRELSIEEEIALINEQWLREQEVDGQVSIPHRTRVGSFRSAAGDGDGGYSGGSVDGCQDRNLTNNGDARGRAVQITNCPSAPEEYPLSPDAGLDGKIPGDVSGGSPQSFGSEGSELPLEIDESQWRCPTKRRSIRARGQMGELDQAGNDSRPSVRRLAGQFDALIGDVSEEVKREKEVLEETQLAIREAPAGTSSSNAIAVKPRRKSAVAKASALKLLKARPVSKRRAMLDKQKIRRLHQTNHPTRTRLHGFLKVACADYENHKQDYARLINEVTDECQTCGKFESELETAAAVVVNAEMKPGDQVWCDLFTLDWGAGIEAIAIRDEASGECALELLDEHGPEGIRKSESIFRAVHARWLSVRGVPRRFVSDPDLSLEDDGFEGEMTALGSEVITTAASSSGSHGRVERLIRDARHDLDRMVLGTVLRETAAYLQLLPNRKTWTRAQWRVALHSVENALNNEVGARGGSVSHRVRGCSTSMHQRLLDDSGCSNETNFADVRRGALEGFMRARCGRALGTILKQAPRRDAEDLLPAGSACEVYRAAAAGKRGVDLRVARWHGPGCVVRWVSTDSSSWAGYYLVNLRKHTVKCHRKHVRRLPGPTPSALKDYETLVHKHVKNWLDEDEDPEQNVPALAYMTVAQRVEAVRSQTREGADKFGGGSLSQEALHPASASGTHAGGELTSKEAVSIRGPESSGTAGVKPVGEAGEVGSPVREPKSSSTGTAQERRQVAACTSLGCASTPAEKPDGNWVLLGERLVCLRSGAMYAGRSTGYWTVTSLLCCAEDDDTICFTSEGADEVSPDVYGKSWDDLPDDVKLRARLKGISDYDDSGSWDRKSDRPWSSLTSRDERITGRWVDKPKQIWDTKASRYRLEGRSRWTPKGFQERFSGDTSSPTAAAASHKLTEALGMACGMLSFSVDFSAAFFQSDVMESIDPGRKLWIEVPEGDPAWEANQKKARLLTKFVPGTKEAPLAWFRTVRRKLIESGWEVSKLDGNRFYKRDGSGRLLACLPVHVDDGKGYVVPDHYANLEAELRKLFKIGEFELLTGRSKVFLGVKHTHHAEFVEYDQESYLSKELKSFNIAPQRAKQRTDLLTASEISEFRSVLGQCSWAALHTQLAWQYETSALAGRVQNVDQPATVDDVLRLNRVVDHMKSERSRVRMNRMDFSDGIVVKCITDGGEGERDQDSWEKAHSGYMIGLGSRNSSGFVPIIVRSSRAKRVTHSSFDVETVTAISALDALLWVKFSVLEWYHGIEPSRGDRVLGVARRTGSSTGPSAGPTASAAKTARTGTSMPAAPQVTSELLTDCNSLVTACTSVGSVPKGTQKRRVFDLADIRECLSLGDLDAISHIDGKTNPLDALTKKSNRCAVTRQILQKVFSTGTYIADYSEQQLGAKKRKAPKRKQRR